MSKEGYKGSNSNSNSEYEDINLIYLFRWLNKKVNELFSWFAFLQNASIKRYKLVSIITLIGISYATINYYTANKVYLSVAIFSSKLLDKEISEQIIDDLHYLTSEKNYKEVSNLLDMSTSSAKLIKDIEYDNFELENEEDSLLGTPFLVKAYVYDISVLDSLERGVKLYLENNSFAQKRRKAKEKTLREMSLKIDKEVVIIDSLKMDIKKGVVFMRSKTQKTSKNSDIEPDLLNMSYLNPVDELFKESIDMYLEGLLLKEELALLSSYEIIQGFPKFRKPHSPKLLLDNVVWGGLAFILAVLLSGNLEKRTRRKKVKYKSKSKEDDLIEV